MEKKITAFIEALQSSRQIAVFDKESLKQTVVMKLLFLLGWDIFNPEEVTANYSVGERQADFCLRSKNSAKAFVDIRKTGEPLDRFQEEHFELTRRGNAEFSVLSNGIDWWLYLSTGENGNMPGKFCAIDFLNHQSAEISAQLIASLEKNNVDKGSTVKYAQKILARRGQIAIKETLPEAWAKIVSEPPDVMVQLLSENVEKICGCRPERTAVIKFLTENSNLSHQPAAPAKPNKYSPVHRAFTRKNKNIRSFSFKNRVYHVKSGGELILKLCEILKAEHDQDLDKLVWHSVNGKYYFSKNKTELRFSEKLAGTDIYVETHLTPKEAVKTAYSILAEYNLDHNGFQVSMERH